MRFLHVGDLHIGKKLHGYDLLLDQKKNLADIIQLAKTEEVDAVVLAGDLYDRSVPPVEAIEIFNQFIQELNIENQFPVFAISGNHDSGVRLEAGAPWYQQTDFYLHTRLEQAFTPIEFQGTQFFLLPYFEPISARLYFQDDEIRTITQAMERVVPEMEKQFKPELQQVLVAHFFVAGSEKSDSETKIEVGGLDSVPSYLLESFDYVALGHLHNKNALQHQKMRYSGSPLKFSLSELHQKKGGWLVELPDLHLEFKELSPLHNLQQIEASFEELLSPIFYQSIEREDYLDILLTDRGIIPNMMNQLRQVYPRILGVSRVNGRESTELQTDFKEVRRLAPEKLVDNFFQEVTGETMTSTQTELVADVLGTQEVTDA
ncbi:exonuclease SbcCD subunit D [Enterococcus sp. HY326]|uniref:exonuclease SbcCD subunit D n=1 Tax=Enterococcus sp. HY326 TaxID=2971265 RepID=UPI002240217E|nr:exonuclease SbcCD subunit D [Enterococcus sp. HY326]